MDACELGTTKFLADSPKFPDAVVQRSGVDRLGGKQQCSVRASTTECDANSGLGAAPILRMKLEERVFLHWTRKSERTSGRICSEDTYDLS
jgi:hypothetical protein